MLLCALDCTTDIGKVSSRYFLKLACVFSVGQHCTVYWRSLFKDHLKNGPTAIE